MNKAELINAVAEAADVSKKDAEAVITASVEAITAALQEGEKVQLVGFGSFEVKKRAERTGLNPKTLETIAIPASKAPTFKPSMALRDLIGKEYGEYPMRLDKYLKVSRLIKRRTVANEACDNERVSVNGRVQRASYDVKVGDKIAIRFGERTVAVEVVSVQDNVGKADAAAMYRELGADEQ